MISWLIVIALFGFCLLLATLWTKLLEYSEFAAFLVLMSPVITFIAIIAHIIVQERLKIN